MWEFVACFSHGQNHVMSCHIMSLRQGHRCLLPRAVNFKLKLSVVSLKLFVSNCLTDRVSICPGKMVWNHGFRILYSVCSSLDHFENVGICHLHYARNQGHWQVECASLLTRLHCSFCHCQKERWHCLYTIELQCYFAIVGRSSFIVHY